MDPEVYRNKASTNPEANLSQQAWLGKPSKGTNKTLNNFTTTEEGSNLHMIKLSDETNFQKKNPHIHKIKTPLHNNFIGGSLPSISTPKHDNFQTVTDPKHVNHNITSPKQDNSGHLPNMPTF